MSEMLVSLLYCPGQPTPPPQQGNVSNVKVEKPWFIHSRNMSHRAWLCAGHCTNFWECRDNEHSLWNPALPSTSKGNEQNSEGQYSTVSTRQELTTGAHAKQEKRHLSLPGGWREACKIEVILHQHQLLAVLWHWRLDSDCSGLKSWLYHTK